MGGALTNMICIFYNTHTLFYGRDGTIHNDNSQTP